MNVALLANNLPSFCHRYFSCTITQIQPRKVMTKMGVKFSKIRKKSCKQAKVIFTLYADSLCAIVCAEMKVFVVWAAFAAITSARQCQLPPCLDQLGLSPQGNITWVQPTFGGRIGRPDDSQPCFGEIYILCDLEDHFNQSTCFFEDPIFGEKVPAKTGQKLFHN